jgi:predicted RNA-binding Zn-ribbon protein involved in translation (DUF1610 family)
MAKAVTPAPVTPTSTWNTRVEDYEISALEPPIDPSEHVAALVHEAVNKPTVLPATYAIQENIGDRISRVSPSPKPAKSFINPFKIPPPDPNWIPTPPIEPQPLQAKTRELVGEAHPEVSTSATVVAPSPSVEETSRDDSGAMVAEPVEVQETPAEVAVAVVKPVEVQETPAEISVAVAEPVEVQKTNDDTSQDNAPVNVVPESRDTIEPQALKPDTKKLSDDADVAASASDMDVVPPATTEELPSDEPAAGVEAIAAEETLGEEVSAADAVEAVEVQETPTEASTVSESIAVEQIPEEAASAVMAESVAPPVEAVIAPPQEPEADKKLSETVVDSAPAKEETASKSEMVEIACPKCESTNLRKNGLRQGKQRYVCKDCGKQFAISDSAEEVKPLKTKSISRVETANVKDAESATEVSTSSKRSGKKKKAKAKGFGNPKDK